MLLSIYSGHEQMPVSQVADFSYVELWSHSRI